MGNRIVLLLGLLAISVLSVGVLTWRSQHYEGGGFSRKIIGKPVFIRNIRSATRTSYIAGLDDDKVLIADRNVPGPYVVLSTSPTTFKKDSVESRVLIADSIHEPTNLQIKGSTSALTTLSTYKVYFGNSDESVIKRVKGIGNFFADLCAVGKTRLAIRTFSEDKKKYDLALWTDSRVELKPGILTKQIDGFFCTDGMLLSDSGNIVYLYYYRNEFIVMDTSMNVKYHSHTIDTITHARISVSPKSVKGARMLSSPARIVNDKSTISGKLLFVHSKIISDNEKISEVRNNSVIDVYELKKGKYLFSFYIPHLDGEVVREFRIAGNNLVCRYPEKIILYTLNFSMLDHQALQ